MVLCGDLYIFSNLTIALVVAAIANITQERVEIKKKYS
jgi:hypothetical protein